MDTFFLSLPRTIDLPASAEERSSRWRILWFVRLGYLVLLLHGADRGGVLHCVSNPLGSAGKGASPSPKAKPDFGRHCYDFRAAVLDPLLCCDAWSGCRLPRRW